MPRRERKRRRHRHRVDEAKPLILVEHLDFACWHRVLGLFDLFSLEPTGAVHNSEGRNLKPSRAAFGRVFGEEGYPGCRPPITGVVERPHDSRDCGPMTLNVVGEIMLRRPGSAAIHAADHVDIIVRADAGVYHRATSTSTSRDRPRPSCC